MFRRTRDIELDEQSGRTTVSADSDTHGRLQPTPSEGRQRWHYDTLSSPHLPPPELVLSDDCGPPGAVGGWAPPPLPLGPQDLPRDYGPDGAAGGLSRSTPRRADDTTTRLRERADASVRRPGLGARLLATSDDAWAGWYIADYSAFLFRAQVSEDSGTEAWFEGDHCNDNFLSWRYFESVIKGPPALAEDSVLTPIPVWRILVLFINREESERAVLAQLSHSDCILKSVYSYSQTEDADSFE